MTQKPSTAGSGDPYWYEWFVGLVEVVQLLDPGSDVAYVAFQVEGVKGWDDVVVTLRNGGRRCYQVKHTRVEDSLTFSDLVGRDDENESLLRSLFRSWREAKLNDGVTKCILYTNREAGNRWSKARDGTPRPPLSTFWSWLSHSAESAKQLADVAPTDELREAWVAWLEELSPGTDEERLAFVRALEIRDSQSNLDEISDDVTARLAQSFGVPIGRVGPLFDSLVRALKKWTTRHAVVNVEELCSELALIPEEKELAPAPPPPTPFFPTRVPISEELEHVLKEPASEPVIFLTAEPGSGKTSVVSRLVNRRTTNPFGGTVAARFFCFEPIRPENPVVAPDASRVHPKDLWLSLLTQLREGLRGRLHELQVPLRNDLLTWQEARGHVLRLASLLGKEHNQRFVIVIDGIDHAARAAQTSPQQTAEFFASLPGPDELGTTNLRLMVVGQPPENYAQQYPQWLLGSHPHVRRMELPRLSTEDVQALYLAKLRGIPTEQVELAIRVIEQKAKGNTLATVFAVEEANRTATVEELEKRLNERRLVDGLIAYYDAIWQHMVGRAGDSADGVGLCLAGTLSVAKQSIGPLLLTSAFADWNKPEPWWRNLLQALGPLLTEENDGFRVRHNDVRVFLTAKFASYSLSQRARTLSQLANHFRQSNSDRMGAHLQLFELLKSAGRAVELAEVFDVNWVFEAAALGIETEQLLQECQAAIRELPRRKSWPLVVSVACAAQSLDRLRRFRERSPTHDVVQRPLPPFLPSEVAVRPMKQWRSLHFSALVRDALALIEGNEVERARALLERWLGGLSICDIVPLFSDKVTHFGSQDDDIKPMDESAIAPFKDLGKTCGLLGWSINPGKPTSEGETKALFAFEKGYVDSIPITSATFDLGELLGSYWPVYLDSWARLLRYLAAEDLWPVVRQALKELRDCRERLSTAVQAEATWWALRSQAYADEPNWLAPLEAFNNGIGVDDRRKLNLHERDVEVRAYVNIAKAIGWTRSGLDPGDVGTMVYRAYDPNEYRAEDRAAGLLVFRTAAMVGRLEAAFSTEDYEAARTLLSPEQLGSVLSALWTEITNRNYQFVTIAAQLANELGVACGRIGGDHSTAAVTAARPVAERCPVDFRRAGVWQVIDHGGDKQLLRSWVLNWLGENGEAWRASREDLTKTVCDFEPYAARIGDSALIQAAHRRRKWMLIGYANENEDSFAHVLDWFKSTAKLAPQTWSDLGWKLWCVSMECHTQNGSHEYESSLLDAVSAAAIRCGASDWWRLMTTTLSVANQEGWHDDTRQRLVDGATLAFHDGAMLDKQDLLALWCLALCFSFWTDKADEKALHAFRDAVLSSLQVSERPRIEARLRELAPRAFDQPSDVDVETEVRDSRSQSEEPLSLVQVLDRAKAGETITLAEAATALQGINDNTSSDRDDLITSVLKAIGTGKSYPSAWNRSEPNADQSLATIAKVASDEQLWTLLDATDPALDYSQWWPFRAYNNLLAFAKARADREGFVELRQGLETQLGMHASWAFGGRDPEKHLSPLPEIDPGLRWQDVAVKLVKILFESNSAEVLGAALEGMHALVAADESVIPRLFSVLTSNWARHWLLSAAEGWAALHPSPMATVRQELELTMRRDDFLHALQAWIVLCRHSDVTGLPRPVFPIPESGAEGSHSILVPEQPRILRSKPTSLGQFQLVDKHHAACSTLNRLRDCGFDFSSLESDIAVGLAATSGSKGSTTGHKGPYRRRAFLCTGIEERQIIGRAIASVLDTACIQQSDLPRIAQGLMDNEDAWLQRRPPQRGPEAFSWPKKERYGNDHLATDAVHEGLKTIAMTHGVPKGWQTFSAYVTDCTWKEDFVLRLWREKYNNVMLIRPSRRPTCPSGRTFLWWLGDYFEPDIEQGFVSGLFVGGMLQLHFCNLDILPPKAWAEELGWKPQIHDPLTWCCDGKPVARYERWHGPFLDDPHGPRHRQPFLLRWLVADEALEEVERVMGDLILKEEFGTFQFQS